MMENKHFYCTNQGSLMLEEQYFSVRSLYLDGSFILYQSSKEVAMKAKCDAKEGRGPISIIMLWKSEYLMDSMNIHLYSGFTKADLDSGEVTFEDGYCTFARGLTSKDNDGRKRLMKFKDLLIGPQKGENR